MIRAGDNEHEAKSFALKTSIENPEMYITLYSCFGIFCSVKKRLHVFDPTDSLFGVYWINGKQKPFTNKQRVADSMATPTMN